MTSSGSRTVSTNGAVLSGLDITGTVTVTADNVTIENSRITKSSGGSGSYAVILNDGADDFTIKDTEITGPASDTDGLESAVWNHYNNPGAIATRVYFHRCADCWEGAGTFRDDYMVVDAAYPGSHDEDIYVCGTTVDVDHSTLINTHQQTATVFGDTICGGNDFTVTNSLLGGGGFLLYPQANSSSPVGTTNISGNRLARCTTSAVYNPNSGGRTCSGGGDSSGYYPFGGYYGVSAYTYSGSNHVWANNVWDDNSQPVCDDGTAGCGTGSPPPPPPPEEEEEEEPAPPPGEGGAAEAVWTPPDDAQVGVPVLLDGTESDGSGAVSCTWDFENQSGSTVWESHTGCQLSFTFRVPDTKYVTLTVTDTSGDSDSSRQSFPVSASVPNPPEEPTESEEPEEPAPEEPPAEEEPSPEEPAEEPAEPEEPAPEEPGPEEPTQPEEPSGEEPSQPEEPSEEPKEPEEPVPPPAKPGPPLFPPTPEPAPPTTPAPHPAVRAIWSAPRGARPGQRVILDGTASTGQAPIVCVWTIENRTGSRVYRRRTGCTFPYRVPRAGMQYVRLTVYDGSSFSNSLRLAISAGGKPSRLDAANARRLHAEVLRRRWAG